MHLDSINVDALDPAPLADVVASHFGLSVARTDGDDIALAFPAGLELWFLAVPQDEQGQHRLVLMNEDGAATGFVQLSADPERDVEFWSRATGWERIPGTTDLVSPDGSLTFAVGREDIPKSTGKNLSHLDLRLEPGEDEAEALDHLQAWGATLLNHDWGELDWTVLTDPSGNEFCLLPAKD